MWVMDMPFRRTLKSPGIAALLWEEADCVKALNEYREFSHGDVGDKRCTGGLMPSGYNRAASSMGKDGAEKEAKTIYRAAPFQPVPEALSRCLLCTQPFVSCQGTRRKGERCLPPQEPSILW